MRLRREPPRFRPAEVRSTERLSPRMVKVTFTGEELEGLTVDQPAASVRLLLPPDGSGDVVMPTWNGNEFLFPDGRRPAIRTFTPRRLDPGALELELWIVVHGVGAASEWAEAAKPGDRAAIAGTGRGYVVDEDAEEFLVAGDETAIPAISQLLEVVPADTPAVVVVEVAGPEARLPLGDHPGLAVDWRERPADSRPGDSLVAAVEAADIGEGTRVWVAGEAAAVQRIRRHLFQERGLPRSQASIRGYWKHGRTGDDGED